jgi:hypothetical protein
MITDRQQLLLKQYQERSYVSSILAEESYNYYNFIKNVINIPLIICNSVMVCINSTITDQELLKIMNIILNSSTGLILSFVSSFKIYEHVQQYHQLQMKYTKLTHLIDSKMTNDLETIDNEFIQSIINDYDLIAESCEYSFPSSVRVKVKKTYENKISLPTSLSIDIVNVCDNKCCI